MLSSMTEVPEPTRAEVSDVATAAILGADCVMLSEETAVGKYPIQAVEIMKRVILYTQQYNPLSVMFDDNPVSEEPTRQRAISRAVISLSDSIHATAIVAETLSGDTALQITSHRPNVPVIVVTSNPRTVHQLALVYGAKSYLRPVDPLAASKLTDWLRASRVLKKGDVIVTVSGKYPGVVGTTDTIKVRVLA
jgi:pyruvate kinase